MNEYRITLRNADKDSENKLNPTTKTFIIRAENDTVAEKIVLDLAKMYFAGVENIRYAMMCL